MTDPRMSVPGPTRAAQLPPQLPDVAAPNVKTIADAVAHMHQVSVSMQQIMARLEHLMLAEQEPPELHTVVLNPNAYTSTLSGMTTTVDVAKWEARSLGILNPLQAPVSIGIGGVSAASNSRAIQCPPQSAMVLPVHAWDIDLGVPIADLSGESGVIYIFRYRTHQPLMLGDMT